MTDFIPFGTPPGSTGNPKQLPGDVFSAGDVIKCSVTGSLTGLPSVTVSDTATIVAPATIGTVTVSGSTTPTTGTEETYTVTFDGTAADATYTWSVSPSTATIDVNTGTNTAGITFDADDTYTVTVEVSSATSTDSPATGSLTSIVSTTPAGDFWLNATGPGGNTSVVIPQDTVEPGTVYALSAGDFLFDNFDVREIFFTTSSRPCFVFGSTTTRTAFATAFPPGTSLEFASSGPAGSVTLDVSGYTNRSDSNPSLVYSRMTLTGGTTSLNAWETDSASASGFTMTIIEA